MTISDHGTTWLGAIGGWLDDCQAAPLPADAEQAAIRATIDTLACAIGGLEHDAPRRVLPVVEALGGPPESSLIGPVESSAEGRVPMTRTSAPAAILHNGTLIRALDCNDGFLGEGGVGGHPSDNIAVALAFAEACRATGAAYLRAVAIGYELYWRLRHYVFMPASGYRWDHVSTSGLVSATIAGLLLGLRASSLANAVAIGGAQTYSLGEIRGGEISMLKASANAITAHTGALGALMARGGITGPELFFEGKRGLLAALGVKPEPDLLELLVAPVERWHICDAVMKAFPAVGTSQGAIAGTLALVTSHGIRAEDVERVEVRLPDTPVFREHVSDTSRARPGSRETADHSFPFLIAVAVEDGDLGPAQFSEGRWMQPSILALMEKVLLGVDPRLNGQAHSGVPATVEIVTMKGTFSSGVVMPPGTPENPFTGEQLRQKLRRLAPSRIATERLDALYDQVMRLPNAVDVSHLSTLLTGAAAAD